MREAGGITVRLWQLALFIVIVPPALYLLVPVSGLLAAAFVVALGAIMVIYGRSTGRAGKGAPRHPGGDMRSLPIS